MKSITLSDHTADQVNAAAAAREAEYAEKYAWYTEQVGARQAWIAANKQAAAQAWQDRKFFAALIAGLRVLGGMMSFDPKPPKKRGADRNEIVWASGNEGERLVAKHLSALPDSWALLGGYRNPKGEIDQVLVGPSGVFAIEIKYINGVVHCDGDRWWSDKYDRYGNLVEQGKPLADKRGRAPSRQLNDSAEMLQSFLAKRVGVERVRRIVVLSHANSRLGDMQNITVDYVATADALNIDELFPRVDAPLDGAAVDRIVKAIQKDHEFHLQGPARRERPIGQPVRS